MGLFRLVVILVGGWFFRAEPVRVPLIGLEKGLMKPDVIMSGHTLTPM